MLPASRRRGDRLGRVRERVKKWIGPAGTNAIRGWLEPLRLAPIHESIRRYGWDPARLAMSDGQAAVHFANEVPLDGFGRMVVRFFHEFKVDFLRQNLSEDYIVRSDFLEVGDSDGLLLGALGKTGFSVNNDPRCIELIRQNGVQAQLGVGEKLDVPDKSCDVAMSFETLEHSLNPAVFLQEMTRVARQRIILSVPGVTQTIIHPRVRGLRPGEEHVFEFCSRDLLRLATHLPLRLARFGKMSVFAPPANPAAALYYLTARGPDLFGGCFRWFDFYVFDVVDGDQGRTRAESAAAYFERR